MASREKRKSDRERKRQIKGSKLDLLLLLSDHLNSTQLSKATYNYLERLPAINKYQSILNQIFEHYKLLGIKAPSCKVFDMNPPAIRKSISRMKNEIKRHQRLSA